MAWDKDLPAEGALAPTYNNIMRANQAALETALNAYFYFATGGTQTGQPRQGSARIYYQAAQPTARLDGDYFDSTDYGTPWIDSDNSKLYFLTSADGEGDDTWTLASTEIIATLLEAARVFASTLGVTGNLTVGDSKFVVTAASGNTAVAGTLGVTGKATLGDGSLLAAATESGDPARTISDKDYVDKIIQTVSTQSGSVATGTTTIPVDDTKPQKTEGDEYLTRTITPVLATSKLIVRATLMVASSASVQIVAALFKDSDADALAVVSKEVSGTNVIMPLHIEYSMTSGGTSEITFKVRAGGSAGGTTTFNGASGSRLFGGAILSTLTVTEVRS